MNDMHRDERLEGYYAEADDWATERQTDNARSRRIAWIVAGVAAAIALLEALALWALVPLKEQVPYTLLVDRQTGNVERLYPLDESRVTADAALTRSFLVQYVAAREGYDRATLQRDYRKVGLWSSGEARQRYIDTMNSDAPGGAREALTRGGRVDVEVLSVNPLEANTALVRFATIATQPSGQQVVQNWASTVMFQYSDAAMSEDDRYINPLGFQVMRYSRSPETLPVVEGAVPLERAGVQAREAAPE